MDTCPQGPDDEDALLERAAAGDQEAVDLLLSRYRERLRQMIAPRIDPAIHPRVDASDVVQETLIEAARRMPEYLDRKPMPFALWLIKTARERLIMELRKHRAAAGRSVNREIPMPEESSLLLAKQLMARDPSPSQCVGKREVTRGVRRAMAQLPEQDREVLMMHWVQGLKFGEIGLVLGIEEATARKRQARALIRLAKLLKENGLGGTQLSQ